jgi:hypothetical protein
MAYLSLVFLSALFVTFGSTRYFPSQCTKREEMEQEFSSSSLKTRKYRMRVRLCNELRLAV